MVRTMETPGYACAGGVAVRLQNGRQFEAVDGMQKRRMKNASAKAKPNYASANRATH